MIFKLIKDEGPISRAEIARITNLSKTTISQYVESLLSANLVQERYYSDKKGVGLKGTLLEFSKNSGVVIGVDIGFTSMDIAVCNLAAEILNKYSLKISTKENPHIILKLLTEEANKLLVALGISKERIKGLGIGLPSPIDFESNSPICPMTMPDWDRFPIKAYLEKEMGLPVFIEDDANIMALGEKCAGIGKNEDNFIYIKIGTGIGSGIICNGQLYRGLKGCAGEIGHIQIDNETDLCICGNKGCLTALAAGPAISKKGLVYATEGKSKALADLYEANGLVTCEDIGRLANYGDLTCVEIIKESGLYIGKVLAKVVNILNPSLIVIGGGVSKLGDVFIAAIREEVYRSAFPINTRDLNLQRSSLGDTAGIIGAASLAVNELFNYEQITSLLSYNKSN